jgi:hypothetical protein
LGLRLQGLPGSVNLAPLLALLGKSTPGASAGAPPFSTAMPAGFPSLPGAPFATNVAPPDMPSSPPVNLGDFGSILQNLPGSGGGEYEGEG